jgi:hypothetical protein
MPVGMAAPGNMIRRADQPLAGLRLMSAQTFL